MKPATTEWIWPAALFCSAIILSTIPAMQQLEKLIAGYEQLILAVTIGFSAVGFLMMMGGILSLAFLTGKPMDHGEIDASARHQRDMMPWTYTWRTSAYRIFGSCTVGREVEIEHSFTEVKEAVRSGAWWRDAKWRSLFVTFVGGMLLFVGLFGIFVAVGPMPIKLLCAGAIAYAVARTAVGLARA